MKTCGLYFGSFNPFHIGHLAVTNYLVSFTELDSVRLVVSPLNPLKSGNDPYGSEPQERLLHIRKVMEEKKLPAEVSDVEFSLPVPLYTVNTLHHLQQKEPGTCFIPVIGADNLAQIERWYAWDTILKEFILYVYPREGVDGEALCRKYGSLAKRIVLLPAPLITISSTFIREGLAQGKNMNGFVV
ncbi:MAG: nicotinate (nicotinamide) nucleotide adenylyltransferase [Bacteroidales bacterium]|jgi:nicotinate-nucleotide adenylyltransferase|nr:nicotinate (nicotinamide) nucleotide adenylyltransferase [Bacteroidales bacterium]MDD2264928.1 nicotinate (nicotinamide) nucleotide adenylyltransferase [Bacteroidales bacterium]MDD2831922.1 nicotinate (nicotinamide) nucleotide adenylyltransferase [Bacteroidales bacterium]MDD3209366.1 nicotinate (nicotinamide) nucleotide adenylyltransferase [Bacteroidales bacterium]MDD3698032.1 nicotinate (nicotinamide) nucleotide adenylyltransferase [Bacteroidales bacterium]